MVQIPPAVIPGRCSFLRTPSTSPLRTLAPWSNEKAGEVQEVSEATTVEIGRQVAQPLLDSQANAPWTLIIAIRLRTWMQSMMGVQRHQHIKDHLKIHA